MGYYFRFDIQCTLSKNTPKSVIDTIFHEIYSPYLDNYPEHFHKMTPHGLRFQYVQKLREAIPDYTDKFWSVKRAKDIFSWYDSLNYPSIQPIWADWFKFKDDFENYKPYWQIHLQGDLNYGFDAINGFVEYITPHLAGHKPKQYVGWYKGEDQKERIELYAIR